MALVIQGFDRMNGKRQFSARAGFTLAEMVIASGLIVMTITMYLLTFNAAQKSAELTDQYTKAVHFSRMNMEKLITNSFVNLPVTNCPNWITDYDIAENVTSIYKSGYTIATSAYATARIVTMSNWWYNKRAGKTNVIIMATAVSSGFQY